MKEKLILYSPIENDTNKYTSTTISILKKMNFNLISMRKIFSSVKSFLKVNVVMLNWFESSDSLLDYIKKTLEITLLKFFKKKIIYVCHNKQAHDNSTPYPPKLIKLSMKKADVIIGLSNQTKEVLKNFISEDEIMQKFRLVPHVSYEGAYKESNVDFRSLHNIKKDSFVVLFFGAVKKYKNIEIIIDAAKRMKNNNNIVFLIAGKGDPCYVEELKHQGNSENIIFINRFIEDDEITSLIRCSNIVALPYDTKSSLNSGSAILSFTCDRTVICPQIGTIEDLSNSDLCFSYNYNTFEEHEAMFFNELQKAFTLFEKDEKQFVKKGQEAGNFVRTEYSCEKTTERYKIIFDELLNTNI